MIRKIFKTGNSLVISPPQESLESLGLGEGSEVNVNMLQAEGCIIIEPVSPQLAGIDVVFAQQIDDFIEQYRPALETLAK
jgi:antitoxin component of MazEF toxin-antitoxin module